ncbi:CBS domain-containing protein [Thiotrichales bacterium 19S11-10]|nr:CBS domain-containing protein [Thiotrichales bacterium 19S11-10]
MKHIPIKDIMSDEIITSQLDTSYKKLEQIMQDFVINHIPIVDDNDKLIGIVSRLDLLTAYVKHLKLAHTDKLMKLTAKELLVDNVISVKESSDIKQVSEILANHSFHSVPVINDEQQIVGIVTANDLIDHLIRLYH